MGDWEYSAQYLNKCIPTGDGLCDPKDVVFIPSQVIRQLLPTLRLHATVDLAGMEATKKGDWTVLTVGGFDPDGRLYILEIHCGHYAPEEVIALIFSIHARYPHIIDYKVEKDAHARVLLPFLQREMSKRQRYPILCPIKRDTHQSKQHRIRGLRPWFKNQIIRFNQDLPLATKQELLDEIAQFPSESSGVHDDILDTLADQMQNREGDGVNPDVIANAPDDPLSQFGRPKIQDRFLGFSEAGVAQWLYGGDPEATTQLHPTGIM
jgi:predicted phage terminase large subunit-like protein